MTRTKIKSKAVLGTPLLRTVISCLPLLMPFKPKGVAGSWLKLRCAKLGH